MMLAFSWLAALSDQPFLTAMTAVNPIAERIAAGELKDDGEEDAEQS